MRVFSDMRRKYGPIQVEEECVRIMVKAGHRRLSDGWREALEGPITTEELKGSVFKGDRQGWYRSCVLCAMWKVI